MIKSNWFKISIIFNSFRELYYKNVILTQKQENVSEALKAVCCLLDAAPWQLGVLSTSKGLIAGSLEIHLSDNSIIDCSVDRNGKFSYEILEFFTFFNVCKWNASKCCSSKGITLPHLTCGIVDLRTTATHILVVEKDTVFRNLIQSNILERWNHSCILITVSFHLNCFIHSYDSYLFAYQNMIFIFF